MPSSEESQRGAGRSEGTLAEVLTPFDAHPFEDAGGEGCGFCGEHRAQIRHHPTRVRAAFLLKGLDPGPLPGRRGR